MLFKKNSSQVAVSWSTAEEKNISKYEVLKSIDGSSYKSTFTTDAKNTGDSNYVFIDDTLHVATNYYKIKAVDANAVETFSEVIQVTMKAAIPFQAESGVLGSDWDTQTASGIVYETSKTDVLNTAFPGTPSKVISYSVTFEKPGTYDLYAKVRVGAGGANDDSFYYGKVFGSLNALADNNEWVTSNNLGGVGYAAQSDVVGQAGNVGSSQWKWINVSKYNGGETPVAFSVVDGAFTQTFQIGGRENGLQFDKFVFGSSGQSFTVKELENFESKKYQIIVFNTLEDKTIGDSDFDPGATASSGLDLSYTSSNTNVATIQNGKVHIVGAGSTEISASQAGNEIYNEATTISNSLTVKKTYYLDADKDGFGSTTVALFTTNVTPVGYSTNNIDCDDSTILYADIDGDGLGAGIIAACGVTNNTDCDDTNALQLSAAIPTVYALNASVGEKNTIYTGYGSTSLSITAVPTGGTPPYTYLWNTAEVEQTIAVTEAGMYSVVVSDSKGCYTSISTIIKTLNVQCGNSDDKVKVCHKNNAICVSPNAVQAHLNHGDKLGDCTSSSVNNAKKENINDLNINEDFDEKATVYPNPVSSVLNVKIREVHKGAKLEINDASGKKVRSQPLTNPLEILSMEGLPSGIYFLSIINGNEITSKRIIKE